MEPAGQKTGRHLTPRQYIAVGIVLCIILLIAALLVLHPAVRFTEPQGPVHVKILAVNDLHGQLPAGQSLAGEPAGSVPVLASYLHAAENEN
ncbi:MAG: hypothetical protein WC367_01900, partial [Methanoregula sp.]